MYQIRTERLSLMPLSYKQLLVFAKSRNDFERSAGLSLSKFELNAVDGFMEEIAESLSNYVIPKVKENKNYAEWFTHWLIIHDEQQLIIGGMGANGLPNSKGEVMIGYYIDKKFEGQGFTTEAVQGFIQWIFKNTEVSSIISDTLIDGFASQKILKKNGFILVGDVEEGLRWKLVKKSQDTFMN